MSIWTTKIEGRLDPKTAATWRKSAARNGLLPFDRAHLAAIEEAVARATDARLDSDRRVPLILNAAGRRERAFLVRLDASTFGGLIEGVETVKGSLGDVLAKALASRPAISRREKRTIFEAWEDVHVDVELHHDAMQVSVFADRHHYARTDIDCVATIGRTADGWLLEVGGEEHRGARPDLLAIGSSALHAMLHPPEPEGEPAAPAAPEEELACNEAETVTDRSIDLPSCGATVDVALHLEKGRSDASPGQLAALRYLERNDRTIIAKVLGRLFTEYQKAREAARAEYEPDELADVGLPRVTKPERLLQLLDLTHADVHACSTGGVAYVGLQFHCSWEKEHGLGVLLHRARIVEIGGADTAFLWWVPARDAQRRAKRAERRRVRATPSSRSRSSPRPAAV